MDADRLTPAERIVRRDIEDQGGRPLSERARMYQRSLESYLNAGVRPRWMERLMEIERRTRRLRDELAAEHARLRAECAGDPQDLARRWRAHAHAVPLEELNELIRRHNEWYPVERDLPMDPRTGRYRVRYERPELGPDWVLEQFPAEPPAER